MYTDMIILKMVMSYLTAEFPMSTCCRHGFYHEAVFKCSLLSYKEIVWCGNM